MKIILFNGSPKKNHSDTIKITNAFLEGLKSNTQCEVKTINVNEKNINFCQGCFTCKRNGGTCIFNDDMRDILEEILKSDVLIFSFGLYSYGMPAALKNLIDRTMPLSSMAMRKVDDRYEHVAQADFSKLHYVMMCECGFPNSKNNFEAMITQFKLLFPNNHTIITIPESPMFSAPEAEVVTKPRIELVKEAGKQYAKDFSIDSSLLEEIGSPMIPDEVYAKICNGD